MSAQTFDILDQEEVPQMELSPEQLAQLMEIARLNPGLVKTVAEKTAKEVVENVPASVKALKQVMGGFLRVRSVAEAIQSVLAQCPTYLMSGKGCVNPDHEDNLVNLVFDVGDKNPAIKQAWGGVGDTRHHIGQVSYMTLCANTIEAMRQILDWPEQHTDELAYLASRITPEGEPYTAGYVLGKVASFLNIYARYRRVHADATQARSAIASRNTKAPTLTIDAETSSEYDF